MQPFPYQSQSYKGSIVMNLSSFRLLRLASLVPALFLFGLPAAQAALAQQSPIDFMSNATKFDPNLPPLNFSLSSNAELNVINNGSPGVDKTAVRANLVDPSGSSVTLSGD